MRSNETPGSKGVLHHHQPCGCGVATDLEHQNLYQVAWIKDQLVLAKVQEGVILKSRSWKNLSDVGYPGKASLVVDSPVF